MLVDDKTYILRITIQGEGRSCPLYFEEKITPKRYNDTRNRISEIFNEGYTVTTDEGQTFYPGTRILQVQVSQALKSV